METLYSAYRHVGWGGGIFAAFWLGGRSYRRVKVQTRPIRLVLSIGHLIMSLIMMFALLFVLSGAFFPTSADLLENIVIGVIMISCLLPMMFVLLRKLGLAVSLFPLALIQIFFTGTMVVGSYLGAGDWLFIFFLYMLAAVLLGLLLAFQKWFDRRANKNPAYIVYQLFLLACFVFVLILLRDVRVDSSFSLGILFFVFLPMVNAAFDYISYWVTLSLLKCGYEQPRCALAFGVADFLVALGMFALLGMGLIGATQIAEWLSGWEFIALETLFAGIRNNPGSYWWLYFMLFSTIIPTMLHAAIACFSIGAWLAPGARKWLSMNLGSKDIVHKMGAVFGLSLYTFLSLAGPFFVLFGFYKLVAFFLPYPFILYLDLLENVAGII